MKGFFLWNKSCSKEAHTFSLLHIHKYLPELALGTAEHLDTKRVIDMLVFLQNPLNIWWEQRLQFWSSASVALLWFLVVGHHDRISPRKRSGTHGCEDLVDTIPQQPFTKVHLLTNISMHNSDINTFNCYNTLKYYLEQQ